MPTLYRQFHRVAEHQPDVVALLGPAYTSRLTYGMLDRMVVRLAGTLHQLGLRPGDRLAICSQNRPKWVITDLACNYLGVISVPVHASLAPEAIGYILADSGAQWVACGVGTFPKVVSSGWRGSSAGTGNILLFDAMQADCPVTLRHWDEVINTVPDETPPPRAESGLCTIIYTSGTTGNPKGVCLTDQNISGNVASARQLIPLSANDRWCSVLPLSHALERTGGLYTPLLIGASVAFARSPSTLSDDLRHWKPTVLVSVPRIFERAYERITAAANRQSLRRLMLHWALRSARGGPLRRRLADILVWRKVRAAFGGRLSLAISGGASLNQQIAKFFRHLGLTIVEGYGLTETSPIAAVNPRSAVRFGTVGVAIPGVAITITEGKEVVVTGPNVALGYWRDGAVEPFREPGTFYTGDLGHIDAEGYLTIIGRAKEIIVLPNGKKVNPVQVEQRLETAESVEQAFVYLDSATKRVAALLVPSGRCLAQLAAIANIPVPPHDPTEFLARLSTMAEARALVDNQIAPLEQQLPEYERVRQWQFTWPPFTEERQELTPTLKLRRSVIMRRAEGRG